MWERELAVARQAAREAGEILRDRFGRLRRVTKKGERDLVTEADLQSEKAILEIIGRRFPQDTIMTEESGEHNRPSERRWLIDPLDGTINFAHNLPIFAVSIAFEFEDEGVLGIVFNPHSGEYFEAVKGQGAFCNKTPLRVSASRTLEDSLLITGFPHDPQADYHEIMAHFKRMNGLVQGLLRLGSAALDLCYVAAGKADGFWEKGLHPWDSGAAVIIVREAGGTVTTFEGAPFTPYLGSLVASNTRIHEAMLAVLGGGQRGMNDEARVKSGE